MSNLLKSRETLQAIFRPKSLALIGASTSPEKWGFKILKNILDAGFKGPIYPINPKGGETLGLRFYPSVKAVEEAVELAIVVIPAKGVPEVIRDCGEKGVKAAVVITGGFSEAGAEGELLQRRLCEEAERHGVSIVGPNCQGVNNPHHHLCASWPLFTQRGRMAVVSQSGTIGAALLDWASQEGLGVSAFVSLGNRADVDESDLISYLADGEETKAIALYIEGVKRADVFLEVVQSLKKPLVVLKGGRTEKGRKAAESHTKSLAGRDEVYRGIFRQYRVHRAETLEELYDFAKALAYLQRPNGRKVLIVTSSGGSGILAADSAEEAGLDVAPLPRPLGEQLQSLLPSHAIIANPLDLTGDATASLYGQVAECASSSYDALALIFGDPIEGASEVVSSQRPDLVIFLGGAEVERQERALIHQKKIPVFPTPERGMRALAQLIEPRTKDREKTPEARGKAVIQQALSEGRHLLEPEAYVLLEAHSLPVVPHRTAKTGAEVAEAAKSLGFPVALKVVSKDLPHKTEAGGVLLDLRDEEEARRGYRRILEGVKAHKADAAIEGVLVAKMAKPGIEVIIGMVKDEQLGPVLLFGLGGVFVEVYQDTSFRVPPLSRDDALEMIAEVKGFPLLQGTRGRPKDIEALALSILKVAELVKEHPEVEQLDLNPVIVHEEGCTVVDAKVFLGHTKPPLLTA